jgi:hypothetical protein
MELFRKRAFNTACGELAKSLTDHIYGDSQIDWFYNPLVFNGNVPVDSDEKVIYLYRNRSSLPVGDYRIEFVHLNNYSNERDREADIFIIRSINYYNSQDLNWEFESYRRYHLKRVFGGFATRGSGIPGLVKSSFHQEYRDPKFVREWTKLVPTWKDQTKIYQQLAS